MPLSDVQIPHIVRSGLPDAQSPVLLESRSDGVVHYVKFSYVPPIPFLPYSIGIISPIRGEDLVAHEVFASVKGARGGATWEAWVPALYPTLEVRFGIGPPLEFVWQRLEVTNFSRETTPAPPQEILTDIYLKESNVPKEFPDEISRFFTSQFLEGMRFVFIQQRLFRGAHYYNFSVINDNPIPLIFYAVEAFCATHEVTSIIDRQFWFSRDEQMLVASTDCSPLEVRLKVITPQQGISSFLGGKPSTAGVLVDQIEV